MRGYADSSDPEVTASRWSGGRGSCRLNSCSNESVGRTLQRERLRRIWYFEYRRYRIPLERFLAISTIQFKLVFFKMVLRTYTNSIFSILYLYNMFIWIFFNIDQKQPINPIPIRKGLALTTAQQFLSLPQPGWRWWWCSGVFRETVSGAQSIEAVHPVTVVMVVAGDHFSVTEILLCYM